MMAVPMFTQVCEQAGIPAPEYEFRFAAPRRWRFDYAWPLHKVALECEGGVFVSGRHTRPTGFVRDMEKYNEATARGWLILRCQPKELMLTKTLDYIKSAIATRRAA